MRYSILFILLLCTSFLQAQFSQVGVIGSGLNKPSQLARDEDQNVYVVDTDNHRIRVYDANGNFVRQFGSFGTANGELQFPQDLAIDSNNGDCYVLDNSRVTVFDFQGVFLSRFNVNGFAGIAVDQNHVYIAGPSSQGLQRLSKSGVFQELIIAGGTGSGEINGIEDFVMDGAGNFYVTESAGKRIQVFDNNGVSLRVIGQSGTADGEFSSPFGIALDDQGRIFVTDDVPSGNSRVQIFDQSGNLLAMIGLGLDKNPQGIVVNSSGRVYVSDVATNDVRFFDGDLDILEVPEIEVIVPTITYGDDDIQLEPTSPSVGAYQFKIIAGTDAEISSGGVLTVLGAGQVSLKVTQTPTAQYTQGVATIVIDIFKAELLVTADNQVKTYGGENPDFTAEYTGFMHDDTFLDIDTPPQISTSATAVSSAGDYAIDVSGGLDDNYAFNYVSGLLTIEKAPLIATADPKSRDYGNSNPVFSVQYTGFVNNDDGTDLDVQPTLTTPADVTSPVGTYPIELNGASDTNYEFEYIPGLLTVGKAALIVTVDDQTREYGEANPVFTALYDGYVNGDDFDDIDTPPVLNTTATETSLAGEYPINAINGLDDNYEFINLPGVLTITGGPPVTGITEFEPTLKIYPNPGKGEFWLSTSENIAAYQLVNAKGSLLIQQTDLGIGDHLIDAQSLPDGIYFLLIRTTSGKKIARKIVIAK
ncbi:MAG: MBG domain-containing protein [Cyclobacteriaceae bacterium]